MERYIFIVIVSLIFASAIKCLVDSENKKEFLFRRSYCASCHQELKADDLIPIFSYLYKKGRCSYCNQKIPLDVFLYEIFTFITIILFIIFQREFVFISYIEVSIFIILIFLGIEDVKSFEVNDELFYLLIILNLSSVCMHYYLFNFLDFICLIVIFHILYIFTRGGLGYGDIK
ncbi:prepilin peptidase, partial [uncultured Gemella sp.]|uniref:prepilin peptidase n=1 Tax=uncultured Gemella sp. TaxID=254352 RepID=UPI0028D8F583